MHLQRLFLELLTFLHSLPLKVTKSVSPVLNLLNQVWPLLRTISDGNIVAGHEFVLLISVITHHWFLSILGEDKEALLMNAFVLYGVGAAKRGQALVRARFQEITVC